MKQDLTKLIKYKIIQLTPVEEGTGGLPKEIFGSEGEEYKVKSLMLP